MPDETLQVFNTKTRSLFVTMISKGYMEAHLGTSHKQARIGIQPGQNRAISG